MKRYVILLMGLFLLISATQAGRPRKVVKKKTAKKEVKVEDPRIQQMLAATQKVMFIDSMVVDKRHFISRIPLSADAGLLEQTDSLGQFTNELKDHRLTAYFDKKDSCIHIAQSDYIANQWTAPVRVGGISDSSANYPFLMPDGVTFYFAQKGEQSIGGYDIFVTRYDPETGSFLKAENIGMPFSSTANDYLYAIDEVNNLGYFATDRRQPAGKVCIYVFIPNETRKSYQSEAYSDAQMRALADISRIADTWTDKATRQQALARLNEVKAKTTQLQAKKGGASELENLRHQAAVLEKALLLARNYYARASKNDRQTLTQEILTSEKELEALQLEIRRVEKEVHNKQYKSN